MFCSFEEFNKLSEKEIFEIVRTVLEDKNTLIYAYDGTRRSFLIENTNLKNENNQIETTINYDEYSKIAIKKLLYDLVMMFKHGIKTICYPMWFCTLEDRGPAYLPKFIKYLEGLSELLDNQSLFDKYQELGIRVIFYGEYKLLLERGNAPELLLKFEKIMELTKNNSNHIVLLGTNIEPPTETFINNTISLYKAKGNIKPTMNDLIKHYYGVQVDQASFYLGFDRFSTDGRPILISDKGNEDLYYTISPHKFITQTTFRKVLFDKLFGRPMSNIKDYELKNVELMKLFYSENKDMIMGLGNVNPNGNYWYPGPQVNVPKH
ncbi:hypothetical protein RB653_002475 [Dictyostelium firmibasis]|uniref:Uncharacterized protein n=1 Tax=Dictyostelium firmibasis TaxID=79012 RepID=A0AAN7TNX2_9MYCE